jgi:hypothetical protein
VLCGVFSEDHQAALTLAAPWLPLLCRTLCEQDALGLCKSHWRWTQGSQAPLEDFDQLVEGPRPISTSCPPGGLRGRGSGFWRENWSKHPPFRAQNFDQLVEDPFNIYEISGLRPTNSDPSTSLRALVDPSEFFIQERLSVVKEPPTTSMSTTSNVLQPNSSLSMCRM